jgi:hypothetical protein
MVFKNIDKQFSMCEMKERKYEEDVLHWPTLPTGCSMLRKLDLVWSPGVSCRSQLEDFTTKLIKTW